MGNPPTSLNDKYGSPFKAEGGGAGESSSTRAHHERKWFGVLYFQFFLSIFASLIFSIFSIFSSLTGWGILVREASVQSVNDFEPEVILRYKVWEHLHRVLGTKWAIALADHFRKTMPSLAPCNPFLEDAVVSSIEESQFIARWPDSTLLLRPEMCLEEFREIKGSTLENPPACSYCFRIGSGEIRVDASPEYENNFKFESRARGILLEEFVTVTDWKRVAIIISILRYWEDSPALGVIENLCVRNGKDVYCHCLNLQSIVEGVCKSPQQFFHFKLSQSKRFYVGSVPQQNQNKDKNSMSFQSMSTVISSVWLPLSSFLLAVGTDSLIVSSIALCLFLSLAALLLVEKFVTGLRFKVFVHRVLACFPDAWRDQFYRGLKRKGCFLAFCDDFHPVLHRATDETELITLYNCTLGNRFTDRNLHLQWNNIGVNVDVSFDWEWNNTRFVCPQEPPTPRVGTTLRSLARPGHEDGDGHFEWHQGERRHFKLSLGARTVRAISECDTNQNGEVLVHTQLQLDNDPVIILRWNEPSYLLFVYLMVKWKWRRFGVFSSCREVGSTNYYHVFSTYELAKHIENNRDVHSYYIMVGAPQPTDMVAG